MTISLEWLVSLSVLQGLLAVGAILTGIWLAIERMIDHAIYRSAQPRRYTQIRYGFSQRSVFFRMSVAIWILSMAYYQLTFIAAQMRLWFNIDRLGGACLIMIICIWFNLLDIRRLEPTRRNFEDRYVNDVGTALKSKAGKEVNT